MILGNGGGLANVPTLDDLFRRAGVRHPEAVALTDPPNRQTFTDGKPRTLTYAEADRLISAFAARLQQLGLHTDSVVAIQLPNTVDSIIALLGTLRAGLIAAMLPLLWRQRDIVDALRGIGCKAIVTCARAGRHRPVQSAVRAAAELFPIRHICCFGHELPDGVVPLDDLDTETSPRAAHPEPRPGVAAAHIAALTFEVTEQQIVAVPRNHAQLVAGGLTLYAEANLALDSNLLSTIPPSSFAGLSVALMPWLLAGGTLALHHACDLQVLMKQIPELGETTIILPGPIINAMAESDLFDNSVKSIIALWRAPERLESCAPWLGSTSVLDVATFGEIGLVASRRDPDGMPRALAHGPVRASLGGPDTALIETCRGKSGTLRLRGAMVSPDVFPLETKAADRTAVDAAGFVDTGYLCRGGDTGWIVTAPPPAIATIGGYRFDKGAFAAQVAAVDPHATILAVPDGLLGERAAGAAADAPSVIAALDAAGANPLISGAFRLRGEANAA